MQTRDKFGTARTRPTHGERVLFSLPDVTDSKELVLKEDQLLLGTVSVLPRMEVIWLRTVLTDAPRARAITLAVWPSSRIGQDLQLRLREGARRRHRLRVRRRAGRLLEGREHEVPGRRVRVAVDAGEGCDVDWAARGPMDEQGSRRGGRVPTTGCLCQESRGRVIEHHAPAAHRASTSSTRSNASLRSMQRPASSVRKTGHRQEPGQVRCDRGGRQGDASCSVSASAEPDLRQQQFHQARSPWPNAVPLPEPPAPRKTGALAGPRRGGRFAPASASILASDACGHAAVDDMHRAHGEFGRGACRCSSNRTLRASKNWDKARQAPPNCCQSVVAAEASGQSPRSLWSAGVGPWK